jgi:hypothetical protein
LLAETAAVPTASSISSSRSTRPTIAARFENRCRRGGEGVGVGLDRLDLAG